MELLATASIAAALARITAVSLTGINELIAVHAVRGLAHGMSGDHAGIKQKEFSYAGNVSNLQVYAARTFAIRKSMAGKGNS
jgi:hypothetical protein